MSAAPIEIRALKVWYGEVQALRDVHMDIPPGEVTALIGPSGCGKSTLLRALNRLLDEDPRARVSGQILLQGQDILAPEVDVLALRRRLGMVFPRPNPFSLSIADNVAWGLRRAQRPSRVELASRVEAALREVGLWNEVSGRLKAPAHSLDPGQQQRLCLARALILQPEVLLLDEVTASLDPIATAHMEDLIGALRGRYTVVIVTHNMQQAGRVSDHTGFFHQGELVEFGPTATLFTRPRRRQTEDYITGRFG